MDDLLSKNNGMFITAAEFNRYAPMASNALFDSYRGADNPNATKVVYGRNRTLDARLKVFREFETPVAIVGGHGAYPTDWAQTLSVKTENGEVIRPLDEDRATVAYKDPYTTPTEDERFYEETDTGIKIHPNDQSSVLVTYLRKPAVPVYAVTKVNRREVYDPLSSVDFDWDESQLNDLVMRIVQLVSVPMKDINTLNYTQAKQAEE